ncbi:hypothetical protein Trydic_g11722 [Trypoxylus dichotomus]
MLDIFADFIWFHGFELFTSYIGRTADAHDNHIDNDTTPNTGNDTDANTDCQTATSHFASEATLRPQDRHHCGHPDAPEALKDASYSSSLEMECSDDNSTIGNTSDNAAIDSGGFRPPSRGKRTRANLVPTGSSGSQPVSATAPNPKTKEDSLCLTDGERPVEGDIPNYPHLQDQRHHEIQTVQVTQCHRCQLYGHGQRNCHAAAVRVKCAGPHQTAECTKRRDAPAKCALCQGSHTANYKGCPKLPYAQKGEVPVQPPTTAKVAGPKPVQRPAQRKPESTEPTERVTVSLRFATNTSRSEDSGRERSTRFSKRNTTEWRDALRLHSTNFVTDVWTTSCSKPQNLHPHLLPFDRSMRRAVSPSPLRTRGETMQSRLRERGCQPYRTTSPKSTRNSYVGGRRRPATTDMP